MRSKGGELMEQVKEEDTCANSHPRVKFTQTSDGLLQCPTCYAYARTFQGDLRKAETTPAPTTALAQPEDKPEPRIESTDPVQYKPRFGRKQVDA